MRRPSATKALKTFSLIMTIWIFCFSRPAVRRIGRVYSRSSCSDSVSRMTGGPFCCCASAGTGAMASAAAAVTAVSLAIFLRSAIRSNIERSLIVGGGPDTGYALPNRGMRLVWGTERPGQIADIDAGCDIERTGQRPADGVGAKQCSAVHGDGRDGGGGAH